MACVAWNMNQNGTHKSFRQTSALTTLLPALTPTHMYCPICIFAYIFLYRNTSENALHISNVSTGGSILFCEGRWQRFCHKPIKSQGQNSCCMFTHAHSHTHPAYPHTYTSPLTHRSQSGKNKQWQQSSFN